MKESIHTAFAQFIAGTNAVKFGNFTLKSGKKSNIFFNFGEIFFGSELIQLGNYFADYIVQNSFDKVDVIFGPAYKGINICLATSIGLYQKYNVSIPFAYNRKVSKTYAEGGQFVGYDLSKVNRILILDDVITDGGTKYEAIDMLSNFPNASIIAMLVGVDREERDSAGEFYRGKFIKDTGINLFALTTKSEVLKFE
ncbi:MAG: orotate phosphoribosyltransferase [Thermodesulfobacteriota bacterium]|nr:orotate phosphoribosyltransferase [Thermodesulfobacteriota bacterium]